MVASSDGPHKVRRGSLAHPDATIVEQCPEGTWEPLPLDYPAPAAEASTRDNGPKVDNAGPTPKDVRSWAREQGIDVPARGKVPDDVVDRYKAAQDA